MILVDTSVWIDYFKSDRRSILTQLLLDDLICTNDIILSELIPSAIHRRQTGLLRGLNALSVVPLKIDWDGLRLLQVDNLNHGLNKVGIPDLIIAQQVVQRKVKLWSLDKHFKLMSEHVRIDLFPDEYSQN